MNLKIIIKYILLVLWMTLIFWFSNQSGVDSSETSGSIVMMIVSFLEKISGLTINDSVISIMCFMIRKLAHFTLYFILGLISILILNEYNLSIKHKIIYATMFCLIYACSDEIHQLFVSNRNGSLLDVGIDMLGVIFPIFIFSNNRKTK